MSEPVELSEQAAAEPQAAGQFYCPGCGARYNTPGTCSADHEPIELQPVDAPVISEDPNAAANEEAAAAATEVVPPAAEETIANHRDVLQAALAELDAAVTVFKAKVGI